MKQLAIILAVAALSGCATQYPGPANYGTRAYAQAPDANGWQVVSVTPVPAGTGAQAAASGDAGRVSSSDVVTYSPAPTTVVAQPVYVPAPVYAPAPVYDPFWYPPISIGLGFSWSNWGHGGYHGGHGRGHR
jgi:hypothetical protein